MTTQSGINKPPLGDLRLSTILTVLPVLSAGLYLMGATFQQGYLDGYGLEESLFLLSTDRLLLSGFLAFANVSLLPLLYTAGATVVLVLLVIVAAILSSNSKVKAWQAITQEKLESLRTTQPISPAIGSWVDKSTTLYIYAAGALVVVLLLLVIAVLSTKSGREQAQKEIERFKKQEGNYVTVYSPGLPVPTKAKQITCGASYCAFWLGESALLLRHEQINQVITHNQSFPKAAPTTKPPSEPK